MTTTTPLDLSTLSGAQLEAVAADRRAAMSAAVGLPGFMVAADRVTEVIAEWDRRTAVIREEITNLKGLLA